LEELHIWRNLGKAPSSITQFQRLRVLDLSFCDAMTELLDELGML